MIPKTRQPVMTLVRVSEAIDFIAKFEAEVEAEADRSSHPVLVSSQGVTAENYPSLAKNARKWSFRYFGELYAELLEVYLELQTASPPPRPPAPTDPYWTEPSKVERLLERYDSFVKAMAEHQTVLLRVCKLMDAIVVYITNLNPELASDYNLSNAPSDKVTPGKIRSITNKLNCIVNWGNRRDQWIADMYGHLGSVMFKLRDEPNNSFYEHEKALKILEEEQKFVTYLGR